MPSLGAGDLGAAGAVTPSTAIRSVHSLAGEVHPERCGTGSNRRGASNGRRSLKTPPLIGGRSNPDAIARVETQDPACRPGLPFPPSRARVRRHPWTPHRASALRAPFSSEIFPQICGVFEGDRTYKNEICVRLDSKLCRISRAVFRLMMFKITSKLYFGLNSVRAKELFINKIIAQ